jgi:hypothetical protein
MMAAMGTSETPISPGATNWVRTGIPVGAVAVIAAIGAVVGLQIGEHRVGVTVHTGRAIVGQEMAAVTAAGRTYDVNTPAFWIDETGSLHDSGRPDCLKVGARPLVSFGAVPVTVPGGGGGGDAVAWVDCRG